MKYGYARVSRTDTGENLQGQIEILERAGIEKDNIYAEAASGAKTDRKALNEVIGRLTEGDTLVVMSYNRFGRSFVSAMQTIKEIEEHGATLCSLNEGVDTTTPMGQAIQRILLIISELEWQNIRQRSMEGQARAKEAGRRPGPQRKFRPEQRQQVITWLEEGVSKRQIARRMGTNRQMILRIAREEGVQE